jgi:hypothetical protein
MDWIRLDQNRQSKMTFEKQCNYRSLQKDFSPKVLNYDILIK